MTMTRPYAGLTYEAWHHDVDTIVQCTVGCSVNDLPDCAYRDWYDEGMSPRDAAMRAIGYANSIRD